MVSRNTTLVPSLWLRIGPACEAGLSAGMRRERVPPQIRKKERKKTYEILVHIKKHWRVTQVYKHSFMASDCRCNDDIKATLQQQQQRHFCSIQAA